MSQRQGQLAGRRAELLLRSEQLRDRVGVQGANLRASVDGIDRGIAMVRAATARPLVLTAAVAALVLLKPGRAFKWIARGALLTSLLRRVIRTVDQGQGAGPGTGLSTGHSEGQPPERFGA